MMLAKSFIENVAKQTVNEFLCPTCFPHDDTQGRRWDGEWFIDFGPSPSLVVPFRCGKGHLVAGTRSLRRK